MRALPWGLWPVAAAATADYHQMTQQAISLGKTLMSHACGAGKVIPMAAPTHCDALFAEAAEHLAQGISVFDAELCLRYCNARVMDILDIPERLCRPGTPFADIIRFNAERGEYGPCDIDALVAERVALAGRFEPHDLIRERPDGRAFRITGNPLPSGGFVTTYTDVTAQVRATRDLLSTNDALDRQITQRTRELAAANAALEVRTRFLQSVVDELPVGVTVFDHDLSLVVSNRLFAETTGLPAALCAPGTPFADFMRYNAEHGEYGPGDIDAIVAEKVSLARRMEPHHFVRRRRDGAWIEVRGAPLPDGGFITTYADVTERERDAANLQAAKDFAERASASKSEFLAHMSHELRTPLNAIIGFSDMMASAAFGPLGHPRYEDYARHVLSSGRHLLALINDILDLSAIEAGSLRLCEQTVDPAEIAEAALVLVEDRATAKGLVMERVIASGLPKVRADCRRLTQVLANLLANAVKFTHSGIIALEVFVKDDDTLHFVVEDTGVGIPPEDLARVMEPFGQSGPGPTEGTGLGLPLSRTLMELHGGGLTLTSRPGEGTRVDVWLPAMRLNTGPN